MGKRIRETSIEIEKVRIVCRRTQSFQGWCEGCQAASEFVTETEAVEIARVSAAEVNMSFTEFLTHTAVTPDGTPLVCFNFLLNARSFEGL